MHSMYMLWAPHCGLHATVSLVLSVRRDTFSSMPGCLQIKRDRATSGKDGKRDMKKEPLNENSPPSEEAPPPYETPTFSAAHKLSEDPLEVLRRYNTVVVLDDSGSMQGALWTQVRQRLHVYHPDHVRSYVQAITALRGLAQWAAQYDADGIDVYLLNNCLPDRSHAACNLTVRTLPAFVC